MKKIKRFSTSVLEMYWLVYAFMTLNNLWGKVNKIIKENEMVFVNDHEYDHDIHVSFKTFLRVIFRGSRDNYLTLINYRDLFRDMGIANLFQSMWLILQNVYIEGKTDFVMIKRLYFVGYLLKYNIYELFLFTLHNNRNWLHSGNYNKATDIMGLFNFVETKYNHCIYTDKEIYPNDYLLWAFDWTLDSVKEISWLKLERVIKKSWEKFEKSI